MLILNYLAKQGIFSLDFHKLLAYIIPDVYLDIEHSARTYVCPYSKVSVR